MVKIGIILGIILVFCAIGYYFINSLIPVNTQNIVFSMPTNYDFKTAKNNLGANVFALQNKGGKTIPGSSNGPRPITLEKDSLVTFHFINEDKNTKDEKSMHNLNVDEFNVHTKTLSYFQTDTVTFQANKAGTFEYYCTIHPEMKGEIIVR